MTEDLIPELKKIVQSYIGYQVEYRNANGTVNKVTHPGRRLWYDKKRRGDLVRITGCFDYFIDEKELFKDCWELIELPKNVIVLVTDCSQMFYRCEKLNCNISNWNVSYVTNMSGMFWKSKFNGDISNWDVSSVTNIEMMFWMASFNGDISNWDVSNVTNMLGMFSDSKFNGDISNWDVSSVTNMECMFSSSEFNNDISNWDVSSVINMECMFCDSKFNGDISTWNVRSDTDMSEMFLDSDCVVPAWYRE